MDKQKIKSALVGIVGEQYVRDDAASLDTYGRDWTKGYNAAPSIVVLPRTTQEVGKLLSYCNQNDLKVVPSGGRTGLAAGACAMQGEVVISMERFTQVESLDPVGLSISVEAGVKTQTVQQLARDAGLFFGLDLASKGSSQIGGNIATNAGGTKLIRFGGMREQVLGLEVVLASGEVLDLNTNLRKDNSGYDLKQLFIGSEGTLGIITRATLKLISQPKELKLMCVAVDQFAKIPLILKKAQKLSFTISAFEFFTYKALNIVLRFQNNLRNPFAEVANFYVLMEVESDLPDTDGALQNFFGALLDEDVVQDGVIAASSTQFRDLWALRENISESIAQYGHVHKNDISLPIAKLEPFLHDLETKVLVAAPKSIELILFGHIGDGNLHVNYVAPKTQAREAFKEDAYGVERQIFGLLKDYKGSISAEHGIGLVKKADLGFSCTPGKINWMKQIKGLLDPKNTLNPGKIF